MPIVKEVIDYLSTLQDLQLRWLGNDQQLSASLMGVNTDDCAKKGELAWISPKQFEKNPDKPHRFQGALLIVPLDVSANDNPTVAVNKPKLAFIRVLQKFFSHLAETVWPQVDQSVSVDAQISENVSLAPGVIIGSNVIIESGVQVGPNTVIANSIIKQGVSIGANCTIGLPGFGYEQDETGRYWRFPHVGRVVIEENVEIGSNTCVDRGSIGDTIIHTGAKIDNLVHVAHNVEIGENSMIIANTMLGGSVKIAENVWVAPSVSIMNQVSIGVSSVLGLGAVVLKDVENHAVMVGNPAKLLRKLEEK